MTELRTGLRVLEAVEIDGYRTRFEHGVLLFCGRGDDRLANWHAVLLRVTPLDAMRAATTPGQDRAIVFITADGPCLSGRARVALFRSSPDGLRLIGTSAVERVDN